VFGHFDHTAMETPGGDGVLAAELAEALPDGARLVFSMGCHSGLAVSDETVGGGPRAADLPAAITARGAVYLATTGYGYGDQFSVGLQERLMTLFAGELDGAVSVGDALRNAKQNYFASQGLYGAYDEKALSSTILYGLPMFAVGSERPVRPTPPNVTTVPTETPGLSSIPYDEDFAFALRTSDNGSWYEADAGTGTQLPLITASRPVQPRAEIDVTATAGDQSLLPAHGAVVTALHTWQTVPDFDAAFSRPTLDNAAGEPEAVNSVAAFPTRLANITTASDTQGPLGPDGVAQRQKLVLIPGQFLATGTTPGRGTQALFDQMAGLVYYSGSTDWTPPGIGDVEVERSPGETTAVVSVEAGDDAGIHRVVALYQAGGAWQRADLALDGETFEGTLTVPASIANAQIRVVIQAVDAAGNVATASSKGPGFAPVPPPPAAPEITLTPEAPPSGWFTTPPTIAVDGTGGSTVTVSIDGGAAEPYSGPFVPSGLSDGSHVVDVVASNGTTASVVVRIDTARPGISAALSPPANVNGWRNSPVTATFTCSDAASGVAACPPPASTGAKEGAALVLTGTATDRAGLAASTSSTVKVDLSPPTSPQVTLDPASRPTSETTQIQAGTSDALSGLAGGEWWIGDDPGAGEGTPMVLTIGGLSGEVPATLTTGTYVISVRSIDLAGNWSSIGMAALTVTTIENRPPTAVGQTVTTDEDTTLPITLTATDVDGPSPPTFTVLDQPAHGTLTGTAPDLVYRPAANYHGTDSLTFEANDGALDSEPAKVTITIQPVNDQPTAAPATVSAQSGKPVPVTIVGADVDGDALTFRVVTPPLHGTLSGSAPTLTFRSAAGYTGADSFRFSVNDGHVDSAPATVAITVTSTPPSAPALVVADDARRTANVRPLNDVELRSGVSAYVFVTPPTGGSPIRSVTFSLDGTYFSRDLATPYDFAGTTNSRPCSTCVERAYPFETSLLTPGTHRIDAVVVMRNGGRTSLRAAFTVAGNGTHRLLVSASPSRAAPKPLDDARLTGLRYVFFGPADDAIDGARHVVFRIDGNIVNSDAKAPYDAIGTARNGAALPLDARRMRKGPHRASATVVLRGGGSIAYSAAFRVA
jgi:hypothetical protein